jgi:hypothetical protein
MKTQWKTQAKTKTQVKTQVKTTVALALVAVGLAAGLWLATVRHEPTSHVELQRQNEQTKPSVDEQQTIRAGRWRRAAVVDDEIARLEAIGYLDGSQQAPSRSGVTVFDRERTMPGYNFVTSGHRPGADLMDLEGNVLHSWHRAYPGVFPGRRKDPGSSYWRRAKLLENGDVIAIFEGRGMVRIDRNSRLVWAHYNRAHHDFVVRDDGHVVVLTRAGRKPAPDGPIPDPFLEDFVTILAPDGSRLRSISIAEAILATPELADIWPGDPPRGGDAFHTNSIQLLDGAHGFEPGQALLSIRNLDLLAVIDISEPSIPWFAQGSFRAQHDARMLATGRILLFDNAGAEGRSRVIELDPATKKIVWEYRDSPEHPLHSIMCGTAQRLPNGNTLISETDAGRALEVTASGETVWEYVSPHRAGKKGQFIASLFEVTRVAPEDVPWLSADPR